ncbi:porin [Vibrio spartinae]|uniref:37 kDa outer membrane protein n=1 Tax=Vibrio spartinae TaxID=1918945 RepID=A0A1N6M3P8_9VIBR|nr:porin [Vibrio spartinae]QMV14509.1 37 kDa outer membrane protein [Vibrio spartinae]SIO93997.1 Porin-like protein H precursor [Vibrio spartinae]
MKNNVLAVAIIFAAATTSVNAANLVEKDGFIYELNGDIQIQLQKDSGKDQHLYVNYDSLEFENKVAYEVAEDFTVLGVLGFDFDDAANGDKNQNSAALKDALIGFESSNISLSVGRQDYASDEFGIAEDYEMDSDDVAFDETDGDNVILLNFNLNKIKLMLSTDLQAKDKDNEGEQSFDAFASVEIEQLELAASYQNREVEVDGDTFNTYGVSALYDAGFATFAVDYSESEDTMKVYNFATTFGVTDLTKVALGFVNNKPESEESVNEWYANITYEFSKFDDVNLFAEISNTDAEDAQIAYVVGAEIKF